MAVVLGGGVGARSADAIEVDLREEEGREQQEEEAVEVGEDDERVDQQQRAVVDEVEAADQRAHVGRVRRRLEHQHHQLGLEVGEDEAHEEGRDDEQHEAFLLQARSTWLEKANTSATRHTTVSHMLAMHTVASE